MWGEEEEEEEGAAIALSSCETDGSHRWIAGMDQVLSHSISREIQKGIRHIASLHVYDTGAGITL